MVREGENGFLYEVGATDQLAEAIVRLLNDPAERARIALANRQEVPERFSMATMVARTSDYYEKLMSGVAI